MSTSPSTGPRPDWYSDPADSGLIRYWDGTSWTVHTLPKPPGWGGGPIARRVPWWQTWWAVIPGLVLCLPLGLVGLWRRPALSAWLRVGLTVATVALFGVVMLTDDSTPSQSPASTASTPRAAKQSSASEATPTADATATPTADATATPTSEAMATPTADAATAAPEPAKSVMPKVAGLSQEQAEAALIAAGLGVSELRHLPSDQPPGTVLRQGKDEGTAVRAGATVVLVVAIPYPQVPSVVGQTKATAVSQLQAAGFKVTTMIETRTSGKTGVVLSQTPGGTSLAKPGSTVALVISTVVKPPQPHVVQNCTPGYRPCLAPASDYDCAGGSGDGPEYANGPIYITGSDPYDLDADGDGVACES